MSFADVLAALAHYSDAEMARPWDWPGHSGGPLDVRNAHWRCVETEQAALVEAPVAATEAQAILTLAQVAWGDLRGRVAGLPDDALDRDPGTGEWTLRQVLAHVLLTERRYRIQTAYAVGRADTDPIRTSSPESLEAGDEADDIATWIERIDAERRQSDAELGGIEPDALLRSTVWVDYHVDVHFRLHRFAAHITEHGIQAGKVLRALGLDGGEAREIVRSLSALRGGHEHRTPPDVLARLDADLAALAASIRIDGH